MRYLLDTNILVRLANPTDSQNGVARHAVSVLIQRNDTLCITAQNLVEFHAVATRPKAARGLGFTVQDSKRQSDSFEGGFILLPETPEILPAWKDIVRVAGVTGKQVHDA